MRFLRTSALIVSLFVLQTAPAFAVAVPTCSLSVSKGTISLGGSITLKWTSANATAGAITGVGNVSVPSGSKNLIPTQSTTYVGSFSGTGGTANCTASVSISSSGDFITDGTTGVGTGDTQDFSQSYDAGGVQNLAQPYNSSANNGIKTSNLPAPATQTTQASGSDSTKLVPCTGLDCQLCDVAKLAQRIINFLVGLSIPLAAGLLAYAGILFYTSRGDPGQITKAKKVLESIGWGFLIILGAYLGVQTVLKVVLAPSYYQNWNTIQCVSNRKQDVMVSDWISNVLPDLKTQNTSGSVSGTGSQTPSSFNDRYNTGSSQSCGLGGCCQNGYNYTETAEEYWCQDATQPNNPDAFIDTTGPNNTVEGQIGSSWTAFGSYNNISSAMEAYWGTNTSAGPEGGNKACAWAVNNILTNAGIAPIDGDSVYLMEQTLQNGRGTSIDQSSAQAGDLVIFGGMSHVGICQDAGCTSVASNSSSKASFTSEYPPTSGSRFYRVK